LVIHRNPRCRRLLPLVLRLIHNLRVYDHQHHHNRCHRSR
uniref:Transposase n=1 Tax=Schistosoma curassoni TaxID=6186 RepID=A0A183K2B6_9TREM